MSVATSQENILPSLPHNYDGSSNMCLELALEGERLCKSGDCRAGVAFFQAAIQAGTDDLRTLSAIYSQLGNAYFYLGDFNKAMQYHKHDLTLARTMGDKLGEAKSSGNLGNTLKVMGKFDEAILCCKRHLELARELEDKLSEGRALYNLGNVYHAKGKHVGMVGQKNPGELSDEVKECLQEAVNYYEENLQLMREIGDVAAQGRACGNLGNTYYLLGDFSQAINYHEERLAIARQFGDKPAERRAHSNLGNSNIFMGQFEEAAHHYRRTLALAQELGDQAIEAQACYSLGNTYTLLRDFETAIEYHLRHLLIAQNLNDRVGEGRACWSLGNAHASLGNHNKALNFATKHLEISKELNDPISEATARMNVSDLRRILTLPDNSPDVDDRNNDVAPNQTTPPQLSKNVEPQHLLRVRRESMEQLSLIKLTPDNKHSGIALSQKKSKNEDDDLFFDLLSRFQSKRMDDQRCTLTLKAAAAAAAAGGDNKENKNSANLPSKNDLPEDLFDMITGMQSKRMDEQRVELPSLPGLQTSSLPDDHFLDQLVRCQNSRLDDQRSPLPPAAPLDIDGDLPSSSQQPSSSNKSGRTVPDDDLFSLIMRFQSGRMDDQRAIVPTFNRMANGVIPNPPGSSMNGLNNTKKPSKSK